MRWSLLKSRMCLIRSQDSNWIARRLPGNGVELATRRKQVRVWRPEGMSHLELRRGLSVADPVPRHWHDEYQFCLIESGHGELVHRRKRHETPHGSLFLIAPGEVHANNSLDQTGCSYRTVFIDLGCMTDATSAFRRYSAEVSFATSVIEDSSSIAMFRRLHRSFDGASSSLEAESQLTQFLTLLISRYSCEKQSPVSPGTQSGAVRRVRDYLEAHYAESIRLKDLSDLTGLSAFHLNRAFTAEVGIPPHAFQTQLRVTHAKKLLAKGVSPAATALSVGFVDQSHLTRHFTRLCVVTPAQYQQSFRRD